MADAKKGEITRAQQQPFTSLRRGIDQLFDDFARSWSSGRSLWDVEFGRPMQEWMGSNWGATDVTEGDKAYRVAIELPGCEEKDLRAVAINPHHVLRGRAPLRDPKSCDWPDSGRERSSPLAQSNDTEVAEAAV
jgi:HSP20 family molecular chaperone IbpA